MADTPHNNGILIGGVWHSVAAPVRTWHDHGLELKPGKGARVRKPGQVIDTFVVHITGAEHPPEKMFANLLKRTVPVFNDEGVQVGSKPQPLGTEFSIAEDGTVYQFCDPIHVDSYDAGYLNASSIGCEIINYGFTKDARLEQQWGAKRAKYPTLIHGKRYEMAHSHPAQHASLLALADALTESPLLAIPRKMARNPDGTYRGQGLNDLMTREEASGFAGVIGHFQFDKGKLDPGSDVLDTLAFAGYK